MTFKSHRDTSIRRFFIDTGDISKSSAIIKGSDAKHINNVLRLGAGDIIYLLDGTGVEYKAKIKSADKKTVTAIITEEITPGTESPARITVAQALLKDKKMDKLIKPLTELGISAWLPFMAQRSVPNPDHKRLNARMERWGKIAREAVKQCERAVVPKMNTALSFRELIESTGMFDLIIMFWEKESTSMSSLLSAGDKSPENILIILGPEGGFTEEEVELAVSKGVETVSLGPRILRSETAAIAATTLTQYFFGDMGGKTS